MPASEPDISDPTPRFKRRKTTPHTKRVRVDDVSERTLNVLVDKSDAPLPAQHDDEGAPNLKDIRRSRKRVGEYRSREAEPRRGMGNGEVVVVKEEGDAHSPHGHALSGSSRSEGRFVPQTGQLAESGDREM